MNTRQQNNASESCHGLNKQQKHVLIVYAHQEPKSFNGALLRTAVETLKASGHSVEVSDLYSMHFEPRALRTDVNGTTENTNFFKYQQSTREAYQKGLLSDDIQTEIEKLKRADLVIFQFPLIWFSFPAIMKGWFDRVFVMSFAFGNGQIYHDGPMKGKKAMLSFTTGGSEAAFSPSGMNGDINVLVWAMQHGTLTFVGFDVLPPQIHYAPAHVSYEQRKTWLSDWSKRLNHVFGETPLDFVHISKFTPDEMSNEYLESQTGEEYGPSVGYHLGKPFRPNTMISPKE